MNTHGQRRYPGRGEGDVWDGPHVTVSSEPRGVERGAKDANGGARGGSTCAELSQLSRVEPHLCHFSAQPNLVNFFSSLGSGFSPCKTLPRRTSVD